jgi:hypothetical protein
MLPRSGSSTTFNRWAVTNADEKRVFYEQVTGVKIRFSVFLHRAIAVVPLGG